MIHFIFHADISIFAEESTTVIAGGLSGECRMNHVG